AQAEAFFFFSSRRRHTRSYGDWSSDVCSSDLFAGGVNTATTNTSGVATAATFTANGTAGGPYTVTASAPGAASPANFSLTNLARSEERRVGKECTRGVVPA